MNATTNTTKLIAEERDQARAEAKELKRQMAEMQSELSHLRHFKSAIHRYLREPPGGQS